MFAHKEEEYCFMHIRHRPFVGLQITVCILPLGRNSRLQELRDAPLSRQLFPHGLWLVSRLATLDDATMLSVSCRPFDTQTGNEPESGGRRCHFQAHPGPNPTAGSGVPKAGMKPPVGLTKTTKL